MPQLITFYFLNQVTFASLIIVLLIYLFSKYILPKFLGLFSTRVLISLANFNGLTYLKG